jgi:hypothetical protein
VTPQTDQQEDVMRYRPVTLIIAFVIGSVVIIPDQVTAKPIMTKPDRKPDLGNMMQGVYAGDVTSDSRGASRDGVTITLTRVGANQVRITSDYPRLPVVTVRLQRAMASIVAAGGTTSFAYDTAKRPPTLDVSFNNEVSWAGTRVSATQNAR